MQRNQGNEAASQVSSQSAPSRLENNECPICFETYTNQNRRYKVCEGKHYVCMNCILQLHTKQCPLCKRYFKIQRKQNNKLKILKGQREEQPIRFLHPISVRALLVLIYARRHGQLPQQLIEALLMSDLDDNQSRINEQELNIVPRRQEQQNQQSAIQIGIQQSQQNEQHDGEESSFSFISMHADRFNRNQEPRDRHRQQRNLQLSLHSQEQISQWSIDENANNNFQNQRRQISIDMEDMIQQKSCECSFFVALEQGFNKLLNLFRKQNKNQNQQEPMQV